jgi:hypothetical protein
MIMKRSVVFIIILITWVFFSCEKENQTVNTVKGRLLNTCEDAMPMGARVLKLKTVDNACYPFSGRIQKDTCMTDDAGYFQLQYSHLKSCEWLTKLEIEHPGWIGGVPLAICLPKNENVDMGNVYLRNKGDLVVTIHPGANSYTDQDTLRIAEQEIRIAGPFTQTFVLDTIKNVESIHGYNFCKPEELISGSASNLLNRLAGGIWRDGKLIKQFETGYVTYCEQVNHVQLTIK